MEKAQASAILSLVHARNLTSFPQLHRLRPDHDGGWGVWGRGWKHAHQQDPSRNPQRYDGRLGAGGSGPSRWTRFAL